MQGKFARGDEGGVVHGRDIATGEKPAATTPLLTRGNRGMKLGP